MAANNTDNTSNHMSKESLSVNECVQLCLRNWGWILFSLFLFLGVGFLYIKCQEPVYERSEEILIKDQEAGGGIGGMSSTFATMGLIAGNTNVYNELISITSPAILGEVIVRLGLDVSYDKTGFFHGTTLFGTTLPFQVKFLDLTSDNSAKLQCRMDEKGNMTLYKFISYDKAGKKIKHSEEVNNVKIGDTVKTPLGSIQIVPNPSYKPDEDADSANKPIEIKIAKSDIHSAIESYSKQISGDLKEEYADVIELVIKDVNIERAVDILNEIVNVYNENYVNDKNKIAKATSLFIEDRLHVIEKELGNVDANIAQYRSDHSVVSLGEKGKAMVEKDEELKSHIINLTNTIQLSKYMVDYLKDNSNKYKIIPVNTGADTKELQLQIETYNTLLLDRNALVATSSESNPLVKDYDSQLDNLRNAIMKGMSNRMVQLNTLLASAEKEQSKNSSVMKSTPITTLPLLSEQRQQSVMENLYLFLLEKREENELSQKFTADNIRIITPPMGSLRPVAPKKFFIMLMMFVLGLFLPIFLILFKEINDTKVRAKKDLSRVKIPFAGEIPQVGKPAKLKLAEAVGDLRSRKDEKAPMAVVAEGSRDVVNEAFRVIRSNIDLMTGKAHEGEAIMLTSFNPGSGKSFISYNLGLTFALKKKKVLLIDCDLRHGSSSMYVNMPSKGVTNYLNESIDDWKSLIIPSPANPNLSILPIGKMPPNPAELLENGRFEKLVLEAKKEYDYVLLDCPPVNIVVDAQIVGKYVDRTLFIIRAGLLDKSALAELNEFYDEQKFKKMSIILNGTEAVHSRYYTYGTYQSYNK